MDGTCSYTDLNNYDDYVVYGVGKIDGEDIHVATLPAGMKGVLVYINFGDNEVDIEIRDSDGNDMLDYSDDDSNSNPAVFTEDSMDFQMCTSEYCSARFSATIQGVSRSTPAREGASTSKKGWTTYNEGQQWVYIAETNKELVVSLAGGDDATGNVGLFWDCADSCMSDCAVWNMFAPTLEPTVSPAPTARPTPEPTPRPSAEPTELPTAEPTPEPTPRPSAEPSELPTPAPSHAPTLGEVFDFGGQCSFTDIGSAEVRQLQTRPVFKPGRELDMRVTVIPANKTNVLAMIDYDDASVGLVLETIEEYSAGGGSSETTSRGGTSLLLAEPTSTPTLQPTLSAGATLQPSLSPGLVPFGSECTYTDVTWYYDYYPTWSWIGARSEYKYTIQKEANADLYVTTIPAGATNVWVWIDYDYSDVDIQLSNTAGYIPSFESSSSDSSQVEILGMEITTCLGSCGADPWVTIQGMYSQIKVYSGKQGEQWVNVDLTTVDVVVTLTGTSTASGSVSIFWDCAASCDGSCTKFERPSSDRRRELAWTFDDDALVPTKNSVAATVAGMEVEYCRDGCDAVKDVDIQGSKFRAWGDARAGTAWVYIAKTTRDIYLGLHGAESNNGLVTLFWDCDPGACGASCSGVTAAPTVSLAPTPTPGAFDYGGECSYTDRSESASEAQVVSLTKPAAEDLYVTTIPAGKRNVLVHMDFGASDLDIKLVTKDGTLMLVKTGGTWSYTGFGSLGEDTEYNVAGMDTKLCVDYCAGNEWVYANGGSVAYKMNGQSALGNEWVTIAETTEPVVVSVSGGGTSSHSGTMKVLWDCAADCGEACSPSSYVPTVGPTRVGWNAPPSLVPTPVPTAVPAPAPSPVPAPAPSSHPTAQPTARPSHRPSGEPTSQPTAQPTSRPTAGPSAVPLPAPTKVPVPSPSQVPLPAPSPKPSNVPQPAPTPAPSSDPSPNPTPLPTAEPTFQPTSQPTHSPSPRPSSYPTTVPIPAPTKAPIPVPSLNPSAYPTAQPTPKPSPRPTAWPTVGCAANQGMFRIDMTASSDGGWGSRSYVMMALEDPEQDPALGTFFVDGTLAGGKMGVNYICLDDSSCYFVDIANPESDESPLSWRLSDSDSGAIEGGVAAKGRFCTGADGTFASVPTTAPTVSLAPSMVPSPVPTPAPTPKPTYKPTMVPTSAPTLAPTLSPTHHPSKQPTPEPTSHPTPEPTRAPTVVPQPAPSAVPVPAPSLKPSPAPTPKPSDHPSPLPTPKPTLLPSPGPTSEPTSLPVPTPTLVPVPAPTLAPVPVPSAAPTRQPVPKPTMDPTHSPTLPPTPGPTSQPTPAPSELPAALVTAELSVVMTGMASASEMTEFAKDAFRAIVVELSSELTHTSEVVAVSASNGAAASSATARFAGAAAEARSLASPVMVTFTVVVDSQATAFPINVYSDDEWSTTPAAQSAALALAFSIAGDLEEATEPSGSNEHGSMWNAVAARVVSGMPLAKSRSGALSLEASTAPGAAALDMSSVGVSMCSPAQLAKLDDSETSRAKRRACTFTPAPTVSWLPSQVPTPAPSLDPDMVFSGIDTASISIVAAAFVNVVLCAGLVFNRMARSKKKQTFRSDKALDAELSRFSTAHIIDLFGAGVSHTRQKNGRQRAGLVQPGGAEGGFSDAMARNMFKGLDMDGDGRVTRRDVHRWLLRQQAVLKKSLVSVLEADELEAFLRAAAPAGERGPAKARAQADAGLSEAALRSTLRRFPMLAFDWDDALGVAATLSAFHAKAKGGTVSRETASAVFRRIDASGSGWIQARELRLWRRMLPIGRPEGELVAALMSSGRLRDPPPLAPGEAPPPADPEALGIKPWDLYLALRDNPLLGAELAAQCDLLDYIFNYEAVAASELTASAAAGAAGRGRASGIFGDLKAPTEVPEDEELSAFVAVAKLKLCRMAVAQHEVDTREDTVAGEVFKALDPFQHGFVSAHDIQSYLQRRANLKTLTMADLGLVLGGAGPGGGGGGGELEDEGGMGRLLDHAALRDVLALPAHHGVATALHRFVKTTHKLEANALTRSQNQALAARLEKLARHSELAEPLSLRERMAVRRGAPREAVLVRRLARQDPAAVAALAPQQITPVFGAEQRGPGAGALRGFKQEELLAFFKALDSNGDHFVTAGYSRLRVRGADFVLLLRRLLFISIGGERWGGGGLLVYWRGITNVLSLSQVGLVQGPNLVG